MSTLRKIGIAGITAMSGLFLAAGIANADPGVNIEVGGATDSQADYIDATLHENGSVQPGETSVKIQYPAEMGPFVGSTPTDVAVTMGADAVKDAVHAAAGQTVTLWGFSEGAIVTDKAAAELRSEGINVQVKNSGDGMGASGITNSEIAKTFSPILSSFGIPMGEVAPVPGTVEKLDANDFWASNQSGDIGKMMNNAMSLMNGADSTHRIVGADEVPTQVFNVDGVTYQVYDGTIPLPPNAVDGPAPGTTVAAPVEGHPVSAPAAAVAPAHLSAPEFFGEAPCIAADGSEYWTPGTAPCDVAPAPAVDAAPAAEAPAPAAAPDAVHNPEPAFFGEAPCIAADGSQYYTPGDAPC